MQKSRRAVVMGLLFGLLGASLIFPIHTAKFEQYVTAAPRSPNVAAGQVNEYNAHGVVVYLSARQILALHGISLCGVACLAGAMYFLRDFLSKE